MEPNHFWSIPEPELQKYLNSSSSGLSQKEAQNILKQLGPNQVSSKKQVTPVRLFLNQFKSPIVLILLAATIISAFLKDWTDAIIVLMIVMGSALLSFFQEFSANNAAQKLKQQVSFKSTVIRDGHAVSIPSEEIVPGDLVLLSAGNLIPADGRVLEATDFFVSQAALTGETFPVEKMPGTLPENTGISQQTNSVFMGTNVRSGSARVLVVQTGLRTAIGQIADHLSLRPPETEFESGIRKLGYLLTEVMFFLVFGIFFFNVFFHKPVLDALLFSIALAVGLTPQLLPAIININLSKGSQEMAKHGVIVRRLESIENFGSMDILCTDKTGTLTQGVVSLDGALDVMGAPSKLVNLYAYLNAKMQTGMQNSLDDAIISQPIEGIQYFTKVDEIPYDFIRKRLSIVVEENGTVHKLISKGALQNILSVCSKVQMGDEEINLGEEEQNRIRSNFGKWSTQGYRVLGVAIKSLINQQRCYSKECESDMVFIGFLLFFDPPKEGVLETIQVLAKIGVNLKVITGDNQLVAKHLGQIIGLGDIKILTGSDLDNLHEDALMHAVEETTIFAEVDPNQKERIILALKKRGHVVGYMGDGINDAPSLHSADVGISVANAVDVAKESADLVLLKQDLDVLSEGIILGRKTFANTIKYIFMATSANFGNMFSMAGASLFLKFLPMLPKQILMINFLTDLPEMTIASDRVDDVYIERPHRMDIKFIRHFMLLFGPLSSIFDFATFGVLIWLMKANEQTFQTGWFIESILSAGVVVFAIRSRLPFIHSRPSKTILAVTGVVILFTLLLPYIPLGGLLGFKPLQPLYYLVILGIVAAYFVSAETLKRWFYRKYGD